MGGIVLRASPAANGNEDLDVLTIVGELGGDARDKVIAITFS